jgi:N-acetylmuramic acid 6-phosphate (MurNAc-6-P) etherase
MLQQAVQDIIGHIHTGVTCVSSTAVQGGSRVHQVGAGTEGETSQKEMHLQLSCKGKQNHMVVSVG